MQKTYYVYFFLLLYNLLYPGFRVLRWLQASLVQCFFQLLALELA